MPTTLYIIGNGFDLMHGMHTKYGDFLLWLLNHNRFDVVFELESVFGNDPNHSDLWSDFETALGQYDFEKAAEWDMTSLYVSQAQVGNMVLSGDESLFLDVSLNTIVDKSLTSWVNSIELTNEQKVELDEESLFLSFNYTDTLETLYGVQFDNVLHIHGLRRYDEQMVVGHRNYVDPSTAWKEDGYLRENNERVQHICDINELYKPSEKLIAQHQDFWNKLGNVRKVVILGHSCSEIDFLYFRKVVSSINNNVVWEFHFHTDEDKERMECMAKRLGVINHANFIS